MINRIFITIMILTSHATIKPVASQWTTAADALVISTTAGHSVNRNILIAAIMILIRLLKYLLISIQTTPFFCLCLFWPGSRLSHVSFIFLVFFLLYRVFQSSFTEITGK